MAKKEIELVTSNLDRYLEHGVDKKHWYDQESKKLLELLPEFEGLPIIRIFAVTSMTTSIEANVHLALKALLQLRRGEQFKGFLPNQILYLDMIKAGLDVPGRKIMSFINALEGKPEAVVVDIWMTRAFGIDRPRTLPDGRNYFRSPSRKEYDVVENYCQDWARRIKVQPRQIQSMVWSGIKRLESPVSQNVSWSSLLHKKRGIFGYG